METNPPPVSVVAARNIKSHLVDQGLTKNALAIKAKIPATTFDRKLGRPEQFTLKDLGDIAEALNVTFEHLIKGAA
ncbi:helix-turn-helix DNA binding domain protein [Arthrobacter phage Shoya]|uniref:Helix-turn-helix DNA binding domain protein n=1 Tax=Arthrobacter phage Shoya TaxID=2704035 RepID=A0A6G6XHX4_9CAUD|nr:helix-turn-helix DNA binding domain protein [Arthrobacter phage Shoya]QIG57711.1 helix-turn-helix DNA binding domain protein [Arthrobacter phage Shoya]